MSAATRVLALGALALGLCPALAVACEDEVSVKVEATAKVEASAWVEATVKGTTCVVKVKTVCTPKTVTAISEETKSCVKPVAVPDAHRSGWEPGHLIEPDSMRLGPGDDLNTPDTEQWVIISSRAGVIHFHRYPWSSKKTEGRTLQQYGPFRS